MKTLRRLCCAAMLALWLPAQAAVSLPNLTDQWWVSSESGWGMAVYQQGDTLFLDIFVYDANGNPVWFTATAVLQGQISNGDYLFTGDLIATTGTYYGTAPFSASGVTRTKVGTVTLEALSPTAAKLSYTVNGVVVVKTVSRQPIVPVDVTGNYFGAFIFKASGCTPAGLNGTINQSANLLIGKVGDTVTTFEGNISGGSCNYNGTLTQDGHLDTITGNFSCTNGDNGTFIASEIEVSRSGISGQFTGQSAACTKLQGQFGGVRTLD
jgi:hypothetical protein